jgi:hypothetical protein
MLRKSKFRYIASIPLSFAAFDLAPAVAGCRFDNCDGRYVVQQVSGFYSRASTFTAYTSILTQYCDGYGGGQNPYAICSVGRTKYIPSTHPPAFTVAKAPAPLPGQMPMVTKYNANADPDSLIPPTLATKAHAPLSDQMPIVTKYRADGR